MAINKKLIHFKSKQKFEEELAKGSILDTSIVFIQDSKEIWTHGNLFNCNGFLEVIDKEIYYNDGSNEVVPIKHPDLSTQPSILPYKFMGQYVYEQLIPITDDDDLYNIETNLLVDEPIFISAGIIANNGYNPAQIYGRGGNIFAFNTYAPSSAVLYAHIVYTSMPEEGDYYGYNNY